jgi:ankyrin repeat protein
VFGHDIRILEQVLSARPFLDPIVGGETPFFYAVRTRRLDAARLLAAAGANPGKPNKTGETPLELALRRHYPRAVIDWLKSLKPRA